jgi:hypothetical protein
LNEHSRAGGRGQPKEKEREQSMKITRLKVNHLTIRLGLTLTTRILVYRYANGGEKTGMRENSCQQNRGFQHALL